MAGMNITFVDKFNKKHTVQFWVYNTNLAKLWANLVLDNQREPTHKIHAAFMNRTRDDIPEIHSDLIKQIQIINLSYHKEIPTFPDKDVFSLDELNELHHMFEDYGDEQSNLEYDQSLHNSFLKLNEIIHTYEHALEDIPDAEFPDMSAVIDYYPQKFFIDIQERDKLFLVFNHRWGELYLGYNTLGKDWLTAASDNDIDLVARKQVRPQCRFAAEFWLNFTRDCDSSTKMQLFDKWYDSLDPELQETVPINNLNELTLGKFLIGEVIIDNYFLKYDPKKINWKVPGGPAQSKWNREVFSTFRKIENIEIFECDDDL